MDSDGSCQNSQDSDASCMCVPLGGGHFVDAETGGEYYTQCVSYSSLKSEYSQYRIKKKKKKKSAAAYRTPLLLIR